MTHTPTDPMHQRIVMGTNSSGELAIQRARETAPPLVVWDNGKICEISADEAARRYIENSQTLATDKKP